MRLFIALLFLFIWPISMWAERLPKLSYDVKIGPIKMGRAEIEDLGEVQHPELGWVRHLRVKVDTSQFRDVEDIYADPETLVPIRIERDLVYLGRHEKIVEYYDQVKGEVRVVKEGDGERTFVRKPPVENVFLVLLKAFEWGVDKVNEEVNLPTYSYRLEIDEGGKIRTKTGVFSTYRILTNPRKIALWIDKEDRIPVRISGAVPVLPYVLSLTEVEG